jgi:hypothetical protein
MSTFLKGPVDTCIGRQWDEVDFINCHFGHNLQKKVGLVSFQNYVPMDKVY